VRPAQALNRPKRSATANLTHANSDESPGGAMMRDASDGVCGDGDPQG
jgi:hypothetical protein